MYVDVYCDTCGVGLAGENIGEHAYETGHRHYTYHDVCKGDEV